MGKFLILAALSAVTFCQDTYYCPDGWVVSNIGDVVECILLSGEEMVTNDDASILCQFHGGWLVDMDEGRGPAKNNFLKSLISDADGHGVLEMQECNIVVSGGLVRMCTVIITTIIGVTGPGTITELKSLGMTG